MNQVTLDRETRKKLQDLEQQTTLLGEDGALVGFFLPLKVYKTILSILPLPFSNEELERRKLEPGGSSLEEFWKSLGVK
jgi:hypothetical protein